MMLNKELIIKMIIAISQEYGADPALVTAVVEVESGFKVDAIGGAGEVGLMQLHPAYHPVHELKTAEQQLRYGIKYLMALQSREGLGPYWINAYNMGVKKARQLKRPDLFPYYVKIRGAYAKQIVQDRDKRRHLDHYAIK